MECGDWQEVLSAVMDGEVAELDAGAGTGADGYAQARAARRHAAGCPECSRWAAGAAALREQAADGVEPGADAVERVLKALRGGAV
ncbi:hypothetical protein [Streptodolium elevatio]